MSKPDIVAAMIEERDRIDKAIEVLRGTKFDATGAGSRARRGGMSVAARKEQSERMKRYWAAKRKQAKAGALKKASFTELPGCTFSTLPYIVQLQLE